MARKTRATKKAKPADEKKEKVTMDTQQEEVKKETTKVAVKKTRAKTKAKSTKMVKAPLEKKPKARTETSELAAEIISKAVKATASPISKPVVTSKVATPPKEADVAIPATIKEPATKYELLLGRYCKVVSDYNNGVTKKLPIGSFISLAEYVIRESKPAVFNEFLSFFILEANGMMANTNALNGIETIVDPTTKTRCMTIYTVFHGLAVQKTTGRKPLFSVNAIRSIIKSDRFTNWVNVIMTT